MPRFTGRVPVRPVGTAAVLVAAWLALILIALLAGSGARTPGPAAAGGVVLQVSRSACGQGWGQPHTGAQWLRLRNTGSLTAEADLVDPSTGAVYAEVEGLAPGTERSIHVTLGTGAYALRCLPEDTGALTGPAVHPRGTGTASPGIRPVTENDLAGPVQAYRSEVLAGLGTLGGQVAALDTALHGTDLAQARSAWLTAHLGYERLGAAYGTFGDHDQAVNGRPGGLPGGVHDPGFTGFHRIEYGLWHGESLPSLAALGDRLVSDLNALRNDFTDAQIDPRDLGLRAHEILEDTLQFELTGESDQGSGSTLATASANVDGTVAVLNILRPVLATRYPGLPEADRELTRVRQDLAAAHHPDGSWTPVGSLDHTARQRLNADVSGLLERLAPVAMICDVRRTS